MKLTPKQQAFADYYIQLGNATEAAIKAGYSKKTARVIGAENLIKSYIKDYIENGIKAKEEIRKTEGQIRLDPNILEKLTELFGGDIEVLTKNIERTLIKEFLIDTLTAEELKRVLKRRNLNSNTRYTVLERAGFKCQCCGVKPNKNNDVTLHIDHIIPFSLGGKDTLDNLQVLCDGCNLSKNNRYMHDHNKGWECDEFE